MREVTARKNHICSVCKEQIFEGENCIQSESRGNLMYHLDCYKKHYGSFQNVKMKKKESSLTGVSVSSLIKTKISDHVRGGGRLES